MPQIPLPLPISVDQFNPPADEPTYTQIFNDTMGNLGTADDGMDAALADMATIADAFNAELIAEAADTGLSTAFDTLSAFDTSPLDTHIANYEAAMPDGNQVVADALAATPPTLLELPITLDYANGIFNPPLQVIINVPSAKVGSAEIDWSVGEGHPAGTGTVIGISSLILYSGPTDIFGVLQVDRENKNGDWQGTDWSLKITPARVGTFQAQYNQYAAASQQPTIYTVNFTVTP